MMLPGSYLIYRHHSTILTITRVLILSNTGTEPKLFRVTILTATLRVVQTHRRANEQHRRFAAHCSTKQKFL